MIKAYRLHSSRYPASDGTGSALHGGRWNRAGTQVIYASASHSLAILEVLVHYAILPRDFVLTAITIPASVAIRDVPASVLTDGWNSPKPIAATKEYGERWIAELSSAVLRVPSAVIAGESNYILNIRHPDFARIEFGSPERFQFDPRLRP